MMNDMKRIISALFISVLLVSSCGHARVEPEYVEPQVPVTFTNTSGDWKLIEWKGDKVEDGMVSIHLKNKEFVLVQKIGSMYPVEYTGSYNLLEEDGKGMIIRGLYDYTYEYWEHNYIITSLTAKKMEWTSEDDPEDVYLYERVEE